ncbi:two-component system response regulator [Hahella sp. CCB-MM4]|uniref:EAL domain-containing protein n=1 Tax=Hahella sp. (strain CCB-MM4) TaxID=1926491 RepID=UPI000B9AA210|nr:EAL domain-containing protein [Hahella sp. CCB-MM4]OZG70566.1 two-component system response regulator [Hahella sp. CCB-MM4]
MLKEATPIDSRRQTKILVVDDEQRMLDSLQMLLERMGYRVDTASGGRKACQMLVEQRYDLALLDLRMDDLNGHQVMRFMADRDIGTSIVVVSGETSFSAVSTALRRGAEDYIKKPFAPEELQATIQRVLQKRQLEREHATMHERLQKSSVLHRYIVNSSPDIVFMLDREGRFTFVNNKAEALLGYKRKDLVGKHFRMVLDPSELARLKESTKDFDKGNCTIRNIEINIRPRGDKHATRHFELTVFPITRDTFAAKAGQAPSPEADNLPGKSDDPQYFIGIYGSARDITERKEAEDFINFQAYHDLLTRLPNRALFKDRLNMAIAHCRRRQHRLAVLFLDLDRFKVVNDTLGHAMGDRLLQSVALRLQKCLREGDTLSRFGGDEFVLLLPEISGREDARQVARKVINVLKEPFMLGEHEAFVGVSVGIAVYPEAGTNMEQLIQNADIAMYHVKGRGKEGYQFFSDSMVVNAANRLEIERDMRKALENGEFRVYYQPQISSANGEIIGVEALVRWHHPTRGILYPGQFIPLAEETKLIVDISEWVLRNACIEVKKWLDEGYGSIRLAVNFAMAQIEHPQFVPMLKGMLDELQFPPENLEIELTENMIMSDLESLVGKLREIAGYGVTIAIDDFGTGYSSLSCLNRLPINTLKVDKTFVQDIQDNDEACIVNAIIAMAHGLKLNIVAEGVETACQLEYLKKLGCQEIQGFYFSEARPAEEAVRMISERICKQVDMTS